LSFGNALPHLNKRDILVLAIILFFLALTTTILSFRIQRFGPEVGYLGSDCRPECLLLKLNAGWPWPYVFDSMGISVLNALGSEDEFRVLPFLLDLVFYGVVFLTSGLLIAAAWHNKRSPPHGRDRDACGARGR
jgi:hypothetical protein